MANLIKDTMVLVTKDYLKWNWGLLFSFLQHPSLKTTQINEDALFSRCVNNQYARSFLWPTDGVGWGSTTFTPASNLYTCFELVQTTTVKPAFWAKKKPSLNSGGLLIEVKMHGKTTGLWIQVVTRTGFTAYTYC